ncbi:MAG: alanine--tRNA ligase, partial [Eubacteriales bacterium]|nr:alanine--tRNA ligase [Eubacteriales bacterium]
MEKLSLTVLREKFLEFFESKGHLRLDSFPLVPQNDNSLLLINAGMAPLKPYFTGEQIPPRKRVTTCQKCVRTLDIENVGKTARHGTFFEMLGNFSFGDYFKEDAIPWAWEFLTEVLEIPEDRLYITIYEEDDEAYDVWIKTGVPKERIFRKGKEDNFWEIGSGPCGPDSEIHFDRGERYGCGKPGCAFGCECDRYIEIWNIVFTQFDGDGEGNYTRLANPNIDTGMGLERLACIMQDVGNLFEVDTIKNIMLDLCKIAGIEYTGGAGNTDVSLRVITDHIRTATFLISDGVLPSNEGRGYILRRVLRRAARHGRLLGIKGGFLTEHCETVIKENASAYPNLAERRDFIKKTIAIEEERFSQTLDSGLNILEKMIADLNAQKSSTLPGADVFKLYDTFGFPIDLTKEIAEERGLAVDEEGFRALMQEQRKKARDARTVAGDLGWADDSLLIDKSKKTIFTGYGEIQSDAEILYIIKDGELQSLLSGGSATLILDKTPFYAESGGQVGDTGTIIASAGKFAVTDT